jgi:hypothetical protein
MAHGIQATRAHRLATEGKPDHEEATEIITVDVGGTSVKILASMHGFSYESPAHELSLWGDVLLDLRFVSSPFARKHQACKQLEIPPYLAIVFWPSLFMS